MRIDRLHLMAFGRFTDLSLDLSAGAAGLHLVYGDNEAGKSTSLRALIAWLFGIPARTSDNFVHDHAQLRIGGTLSLSSGRSLSFVRRKGNRNTLLNPDTETPLPDDLLAPFLLGMDQSLFERLHGIDHDRLIQGGRDILSQSGDMGQALFGAASGMTGLRGILRDLEESASNLFAVKAVNRVVNEAIGKLKEAEKRTKESTLSVEEWHRLIKSRDEVEQKLAAVAQEISALSRERSRLERLRRVRTPLLAQQRAQAALGELSGVRLLPEDFAKTLDKIRSDHRTAETSLKRAEAKRARLASETDALCVRQELLDNDVAIDKLYKNLGAIEKEQEDLPKREGEQRLLRTENEERLKGIRADLDLKSADALRPVLCHRKWIAELAGQHGLLGQEAAQADEAVRDIEAAQQALQAERALLRPARDDIDFLKAKLAAVRKEGDIEKRLAEAVAREARERAACESELARLGRFSGSIEALSRLALPLLETLDRFERRFDALTGLEKESDREVRDAKAAEAEAAGGLRALLASGEVPSLAELTTARDAREASWRRIRRHYIEGVPGDEPEGEGEALPAIYEVQVAAADAVADRLRFAADLVQQRTHLEDLIAKSGEKAARAGEARKATDDETARCDAEWRAIWDPLGIRPGTPREMKQWVLKAEQLLTRADALSAASDEVTRLEAGCRAHVVTLDAMLSALTGASDAVGAGLEASLNRLAQWMAHAEAEIATRHRLEGEIEKGCLRLARAREKRDAVGHRWTKWRRDWAQAVVGLGLSPDAHPLHATEVVEQLDVFFKARDKSEELDRRILGIRRDIGDFEARVFAFADEKGIPREGVSATRLTDRLHRGLTEAREARAGRRKLADQIKEQEGDIEDARLTLQGVREELAALCRQADVTDETLLEPMAAQSEKRRLLEKHLASLQEELLRHGDGCPPETLAEEAAALDPDALERDIAQIVETLDAQQAQRDRLRDLRQSLLDQMEAKEGGSQAAQAAEEAAGYRARIVSGAEQYLKFKIAALILKQQIERYRQANQTPLLARAGALFAELTLNAFAGLRDDRPEEGTPVLLGVRPDNREVAVAGMSDGTRDQLYLALRLATLEQGFANAEPMPFIVDDILVGFDDRRTGAGLRVLAELARKTQVLLFTHHRRVVELAETLDPPAGLFIHALM